MTDEARVIRMSDLVAIPWPTGRGTTRDVVRHTTPKGRIDWLVSIADLTEDAPFSHFPGIDRIFTLIAGDPVELTLAGDPPMRCGLLVPASFPGDRPTRMSMTGGPSRALNVFVDRTRRRARVAVRSVAAGHADPMPAAARAVHGLVGRVEIGTTWIGPGDTLLPHAPVTVRALGAPATMLVVEIEDAAGRP